MSRVGIGIRPPKKRALGIVDVNVLYHSLSGLASGHSGRLAHTATIRPLGCSRKMRPLAFLDPRAFIGTNPTRELVNSGLPVIQKSLRTILHPRIDE
jgi:hypothetical protein